jgi:hypothetical protein
MQTQPSDVREWQLVCPKHGDQGHIVGVEVFVTGLPNREPIERRYCMECWIELMDRECRQLIYQSESG